MLRLFQLLADTLLLVVTRVIKSLALFQLFEFFWIAFFEFLADLVQLDDVKRFFSICATHQNVGKFVVILKSGPEIVDDNVSSFAIQVGLASFDNGNHFLSEEPVCRHESHLSRGFDLAATIHCFLKRKIGLVLSSKPKVFIQI